MHTYGEQDDGAYRAPRDTACYAILKENLAGRGSPHGGAWLAFNHVPESELRAAFGPVIDRLASNGINLLEDAVEVSPIAHYHMGGLRVNAQMQTSVPGLFAAGEAVGGASGANRLSGNAISEALVFGHVAGYHAADNALTQRRQSLNVNIIDAATISPQTGSRSTERSAVGMLTELSALMWQHTGPLRDHAGLKSALSRIHDMGQQHQALVVPDDPTFNNERNDWYELGAALLVAEAVSRAALARTESRGAHQRDDYPATDPDYAGHQRIRLDQQTMQVSFRPIEQSDT